MKHLLESIKSIRKEIEVLGQAKKELQEKITSLESQEQSIRSEILNEMSINNKRYENFDGLAEIKVQKNARSYETLDEQELVNFLKSMGKYEDIVKTTVKVSSAPLTKFLDELRLADAIPSCVKLKEQEDSLRITFESNKKEDAVVDTHKSQFNKSKMEEWSVADADSLDGV